MNRLKQLSTVLIGWLFFTSYFAQLPLWSIPNMSYKNGLMSPLPVPTVGPFNNPISWPNGYDGSQAEFAHNIMHDQNGDLLFFIIDGYIFDKNGWLMSSTMAGLGDGNFSIIPVAGNCNLYHIISCELPTQNTPSCGNNYTHDIYYNTLDLTAGQVEYSPNGGMVNNNISLRNLLPQSVRNSTWNDHPKRRGTNCAITELDANNNRYLFLQSDEAIYRYKITPAGINYDNYYWESTLAQISSLIPCGSYKLSNIGDDTEMEIVKLANGNYRLAFEMALSSASNYPSSSGEPPTVAIVDIDGTNLQIIPSTLQLIPFDTQILRFFYKRIGI